MDVQIVYSPAPGPGGGVALVTNNDSGYLSHGQVVDTQDFVLEIKAAFPWSTYGGTFHMIWRSVNRGAIEISNGGAAKFTFVDTAGVNQGNAESAAAAIPDNVQGVFRATYDGVNTKLFWNGSEIATAAFTGDFDLTRPDITYLANDPTGTVEPVNNLEYIKCSRDGEATYLVDMGPQNAAAWNAGTNSGDQTMTVYGTFVDE